MNPFIKTCSLALLIASASTLSWAESLEDIYQLALQNDAKLKAAEASYRANIEREEQAFSQLLPQVIGSYSYSESDQDYNSRTRLATSEGNSTSETTTLSISLEQKLFDLSSWFSFKGGKALTEQAEAQLAADQQALIIRVATAYFNVLRAQDNLAASKAEERATQRQLEQTQQRYDVGLIAITDVHEARAVYDNTVVQRLTFEGQLGTAYEALSVLTSQTHNSIWSLKEDYPVIDPTPLDRKQWVEFALKNNYQLKAVTAAKAASHQNAKAKKMNHMPTVTATYQYNDTSSDNDFSDYSGNDLFDDSEGSVWAVRLSVPIFSGGGISSQRREAYEQYNASFQQEIDTRRGIIQGTRTLHLNVTTDVQRVKARARGIISTRSALEATEAGYEVGTRNIVDVLQAQRGLYAAIRDYANSRYDYVINLLTLKQQAGLLSPQDILDLNTWLTPLALKSNP